MEEDIQDKEFLVRLESYITDKESDREYLGERIEKAEEASRSLNPYLVAMLESIRNLAEKMEAELYRIKKAEILHEMKFVQEGEKIYLHDFLTGKKREVEIMTEEEFHNYVNRRFGFKIY